MLSMSGLWKGNNHYWLADLIVLRIKRCGLPLSLFKNRPKKVYEKRLNKI